MIYDVEMFEKTLVLELLELLGDDKAQDLIQVVHESRLQDRTPSEASVDAAVFHFVDERSPSEYADEFCATASQIAANEEAF